MARKPRSKRVRANDKHELEQPSKRLKFLDVRDKSTNTMIQSRVSINARIRDARRAVLKIMQKTEAKELSLSVSSAIERAQTKPTKSFDTNRSIACTQRIVQSVPKRVKAQARSIFETRKVLEKTQRKLRQRLEMLATDQTKLSRRWKADERLLQEQLAAPLEAMAEKMFQATTAIQSAKASCDKVKEDLAIKRHGARSDISLH